MSKTIEQQVEELKKTFGYPKRPFPIKEFKEALQERDLIARYKEAENWVAILKDLKEGKYVVDDLINASKQILEDRRKALITLLPDNK